MSEQPPDRPDAPRPDDDPGQVPPTSWSSPPAAPSPYGQATQPAAGQADYWAQQGNQQPPVYGYPTAPPNDGRGVAAMVVGIVGLVLSCLYGVGLIASPVALLLGRSAKKRIDAAGGRLGGRGMAQAGFVLGIIGTVLLVLWIAVVVLLVVAYQTSPSFREGFDTGFE